jgi:hypothetical protein
MIEWLFDAVAPALGTGAFCAMAVTLAAPLAIGGLWLRRRARRAIERLRLVESARRAVRDVQAGDVALVGEWRAIGGQRALLAADGAEVIIDHRLDQAAIADGARVSVFGRAVRRAPDPRGGGYRSSPLWVVETADEGHFVRPQPTDPRRERRRAHGFAGLGAALVAVSLGAMIAGSLIAVRSAQPYDFGDLDHD